MIKIADKTNTLKEENCFFKNEAVQGLPLIKLHHFGIFDKNQIGAYLFNVVWKNVRNNFDDKSNKGLVLSQESSVLYGNKICVNTYHYHFPVINNVAWLIIGLYHIKCVIEFLMLQISTRSCIYKKLHNKVRVVYPLPK